MGDKTAIEWTDATWNPVSGCTKVSTGCKFCYAERVSKRMGQEFTKITLHPERLEIPLHWKKPRRIFVNSMSDLFHEDLEDQFIRDIFRTMAQADWHTFQVLTKRPRRMLNYLKRDLPDGTIDGHDSVIRGLPLPNVWLGVSCENQEQGEKRIPLLLQTPAAVRFVSLEPLLGPIDLRAWFYFVTKAKETPHEPGGVDWVIVGGESGGPSKRALVEKWDPPGPHGWMTMPEAVTWVRAIRDQCQAAGVPFHFKQWGGPRPTSAPKLRGEVRRSSP